MKLKDKAALVTGGGSGIGRAIALLFAQEGARVIVNDINLEWAQKTVEAMGEAKPRGLAIRADVADSAQVKAMFDEIERKIGTLDILVNNAGVAESSPEDWPKMNARGEARMTEALGGGVQTQWDITREMTDADWNRMIAVHLTGTFYCTRESLRLMGGGKPGVIINMSSIAGLMGLDAAPHYSAAKAGIIGLTRAQARELASLGIRVIAICPGWIETPMTAGMSPTLRTLGAAQTPLGRFGQPEEVATVALFLAGEEASFMTGQWVSPNGGLFIG